MWLSVGGCSVYCCVVFVVGGWCVGWLVGWSIGRLVGGWWVVGWLLLLLVVMCFFFFDFGCVMCDVWCVLFDV